MVSGQNNNFQLNETQANQLTQLETNRLKRPRIHHTTNLYRAMFYTPEIISRLSFDFTFLTKKVLRVLGDNLIHQHEIAPIYFQRMLRGRQRSFPSMPFDKCNLITQFVAALATWL